MKNSSFKLISHRWHEKRQLRSSGASGGDWLERHRLCIRPTAPTINLMCWKPAGVPRRSHSHQHAFQAGARFSILHRIFTSHSEDTSQRVCKVKSKVADGKKRTGKFWAGKTFLATKQKLKKLRKTFPSLIKKQPPVNTFTTRTTMPRSATCRPIQWSTGSLIHTRTKTVTPHSNNNTDSETQDNKPTTKMYYSLALQNVQEMCIMQNNPHIFTFLFYLFIYFFISLKAPRQPTERFGSANRAFTTDFFHVFFPNIFLCYKVKHSNISIILNNKVINKQQNLLSTKKANQK